MTSDYSSDILSFKKTRYAPTPSGYLHLGNIYSFILTYSLAKKFNAKILLRIDDLDKERVRKEYIQDIFDTLDYLELPYDEGPKNLKEFSQSYSQKLRLPLYLENLEKLKKSGSLFACNCSRSYLKKFHPKGFYTGICKTKALSFKHPQSSWRLDLDSSKTIMFQDLQKGILKENIPEEMIDFIVRRKDGLPSYQLTSVTDDIYFDIDLVVRGLDLYHSSIAQIYLADVLESKSFSKVTFLHHPIMLERNKQKLSKSAGSTSIQYLRKRGKKKADIFQIIGNWLGIRETLNSVDEIADCIRDYGTY